MPSLLYPVIQALLRIIRTNSIWKRIKSLNFQLINNLSKNNKGNQRNGTQENLWGSGSKKGSKLYDPCVVDKFNCLHL